MILEIDNLKYEVDPDEIIFYQSWVYTEGIRAIKAKHISQLVPNDIEKILYLQPIKSPQ